MPKCALRPQPLDITRSTAIDTATSESDPWAVFNANLARARRRLGCERSGAWYRGHANRAWSLAPTLLRYAHGPTREQNLFYQFISRGGPLLEQGTSSWETLALMRHHGVATRLLDWTESLAVAVYFAMSGDCEAPCIWLLNPYRLNHASLGQHWVLNLELDGKLSYDRSFVRKEEPWPYALPVAIDSPWRNRRLSAQRGYFTLHGIDPRPLEAQGSRYVQQINIPVDALEACRKFLEHSGLDEFSLFPDLDGLSRSLSRRYGFA